MKFKYFLRAAAAVISIAAIGALVYTVPRNVRLKPIASVTACAGKYSLFFDDKSGSFSLAKGDTAIFENAVCAYSLNGKTIRSSDYGSFDITQENIEHGKKITVLMTAGGMNDLIQTFCLYEDKDYITTQVSVAAASGEIQTNYIAPVIIEKGKLQNGDFKWKNVLEVPFDNDGWVQFNVNNLLDNTVSYEVGALFTADEGGGFIMGSLNHDIWKSAVRFKGGFGKIQSAELYCGATDPRAGGEPHGSVAGSSVSSPLMFIGVYDNWKNGMNEFAKANTEIQPKRKAVSKGVPIGWNSWGSVQFDINYETAVNTSQYIKDNYQSLWQSDGADVYVNLDSGWDFLSDEELKSFVDYCHSNGQKAGAYWGPFVSWLDEEGMKNNYIAGTEFTYNDVRLKKSDGSYYGNEVDGCYPLDVTHPAVKLQARQVIGKFRDAGFDYIKLDFLVQGSFEGDFYDDSIKTGIQAYNYGMKYVTDFIGDDIFINLAMSPTFPYQYANGRRLACDSYYKINDTEYTLNSVTYGFWEQGLYDYTDPDHIVVWGREADAEESEARSRATSGVISGTSFLAGDNFVNPNGDKQQAKERFDYIFTNRDIISLAKKGKIFTPVITDVSKRTANIFKLEADGRLYIAVLNYDKEKHTFKVDLEGKSYAARELWRGTRENVNGALEVTLNGKDSAIYELTPVN